MAHFKSLCLHSSTFISSPILILFTQNVYYYKKLDEFNFEGILNDRTRVMDPWFYENCVILSCLHSSNHKYLSILMKLYHNVYGHKISDEFDYERYPTSIIIIILYFKKVAQSVKTVLPWGLQNIYNTITNILRNKNIDNIKIKQSFN